MNIKENIPLKNFTTFKIGGLAKFFVDVIDEESLKETVDFAKSKKLPFFILGGGSNILVSDNGFNGLVIRMNMKGISYDDDGNKTVVTGMAGVLWDDLVKDVVEHKLFGLENLSAIPGTVGACPVQNIGAYGAEVKDTIVKVRVFDAKENKFRDLTNIECGFGYRTSIFKKAKYKHLIIVSVSFALSKNSILNTEYKDLKNYFTVKNIIEPSIEEVRKAVIEIRGGKFPDLKTIGTAGSFFKNPIITKTEHKELIKKYPTIPSFDAPNDMVKVSLAWILDNACSLKGFTKGSVGLFKNQPLVLVNLSDATSEDVRLFAEEIVKIVFEKTNISIEPEVEYVPN